jgi:hypothetical protein
MVKTRRVRRRETGEKQELRQNMLVDLTKQMGNRQCIRRVEDSRGTNHFADKPGGEFAGFHLEGQIPGG